MNKNSDFIPSTPFRYFYFIIKPYKWWFFGSLFFIAVAAATVQGSSYLFKFIIDAVETGNINQAFFWGLMFPVMTFAVQLAYRIHGVFMTKLTHQTQYDGMDFWFNHLTKHSHRFFSDHFAGSLHSKIKNIVGGTDQLIPNFAWIFDYLVSFFVSFVIIFSTNTTLGFLFLLLLGTIFVANRFLSPKKFQLSRERADALSGLSAGTIDILSNISATRLYARFDYEKDRLNKLNKAHRQAGLKSAYFTEKLFLINAFILFIFSVGMFWLMLTKWQTGIISTGEMILISSLLFNMSGSFLHFGNFFNSVAKGMGEIQEGLDTLLTPFDLVDQTKAKGLVVKNGAIEFKEVSFSYKDHLIFSDFNLTIPSQQRLGLVGLSGAGKSTLISLLLRQYSIDRGSIMLDGQDISVVTQDSLHEAIAVVPQEPILFHRSIRDNILYGNPDATEEELISATKKAQAHNFISSLNQGYDTLVGERGVKLSGGQRQRVIIARAILKDAPILILDEATSALDSESEVAIQKALHQLMRDKTVITIAHRLSTLREMDRIIVLENGKIIEDGSHDTLKNFGGLYQKLWEKQAGGFVGE